MASCAGNVHCFVSLWDRLPWGSSTSWHVILGFKAQGLEKKKWILILSKGIYRCKECRYHIKHVPTTLRFPKRCDLRSMVWWFQRDSRGTLLKHPKGPRNGKAFPGGGPLSTTCGHREVTDLKFCTKFCAQKLSWYGKFEGFPDYTTLWGKPVTGRMLPV